MNLNIINNKSTIIIDDVIEECAEIIHILSKIKKYGWNNYHPKDKEMIPNYKLLLHEINDVENKIKLLKNEMYEEI